MHECLYACINEIYDIHYQTFYSDAGRQPGNKTARHSVPSDHHPYRTHTHAHTHTHADTFVLSVPSENPGIEPGFTAATAESVESLDPAQRHD